MEVARVRGLLGLAAALFLVAEVTDVLSLPGEEAFELTSTLAGVLAVACIIDAHLGRRISRAASHDPQAETA